MKMYRLNPLKCFLLVAMLLSLTFSLSAELKLNRHFSDNMVIQRDQAAAVTGLADKGAKVTVDFAGQKKNGTADENGVWKVTLDAMVANPNPQKMTVTAGGETVSIANVLVGDVYLIARQTSVDISLGRDEKGKIAASQSATDPKLRVMVINTIPERLPQKDLSEKATTGWSDINKETALNMTGSTYYLAKELATKSDVPTGIIDLNLGYAFPIGWLSYDALMETEKFYGSKEVAGRTETMIELAELVEKGEPLPKKGLKMKEPVKYPLFPAGGFNAVLNPLKGLALKGAIVQLGNDYPYMIYDGILKSENPFDRKELNDAYVLTYDIRKVGFRMEPVTTPRIPREWRKVIGGKDMSMALIVPPGSSLNTLGQHNCEMRELQRQMAEENQNVSVILPGTENTPFSSQPEDDELLAKRCLNWIQGISAPMFDKVDTDFNKATVYFKKGTADGLKAEGNALDYFEVAGLVGDYSPAKAVIDGDKIKLESDTVNRIARVRYNWNANPNQELKNAAGLPVFPFRSERIPYHWFVTNKESDLPMEYSTPANEWKKSDVTLINGQMKTHGYDNFTGWVGPAGFKTGPFGPNMGVREVMDVCPAAGKIFVGDVIYSANGKMLGEKAWEVMGAAITHSESEAGGGKLVLGVRRKGQLLDIELTLPIMGTYSSTSPYDCPKTEKILANLKKWTLDNGADNGFLNSEALYMLGTGDPMLLACVRRNVKALNMRDPNRPVDTSREGKSWHNSADAILQAEYFFATGDRSVLPHLDHACKRILATQNQQFGGWRQNFPGGATYGLIPNAGLPGVMGLYFARLAGLDVDTAGYTKAIDHYRVGKAETGFLIYGFGKCERPVPPPFDPDDIENGRLNSFNGGLSAAGLLMGFIDNHRAAHLCSFISSRSWNNTFGGHGGNFWNNFWTPLGAHAHGKKAFTHFWKNYRWYREMNRFPDGSLIQRAGGQSGSANGLALVAPLRRIQITGAPKSPFAADVPEYLKPALEAHYNGDYEKCEKLVTELLASGKVGKNELETVVYLGDTARLVRESLKFDKEVAALSKKVAPKKNSNTTETESGAKWQCLVSELNPEGAKKSKKGAVVEVAAEAPAQWKIKVVEGLADAPKDWTTPDFDDSSWMQTNLPISWRMYHTVLLRTKFNVADKDAYDLLRFRAWLFRQQGIEIYLNGELIGKVNNLEKKTGDVDNEFKPSALRLLKNGENTLAVTSTHNWRWGMLFMKVYNDGFDFNLDARLKDK